jgi:inosose dehydratase
MNRFSGQLLTHTVEEIMAIEKYLTLLKTLGAKVVVYCEVSHCIHGQQEIALSMRLILADDQLQDFYKKIKHTCKTH